MIINDFDDVFEYIGGFGPYQYIQFGMFCFINILMPTVIYGQIFLALTPPHWCASPPEFEQFAIRNNLTEEDLLRLTIPPSDDGVGYSKCSRYNISLTQNELLWNKTDTVTSCAYGWKYNFSSYYPSITSELNWVCDEDWKAPFAQTLFFIGSVIGGPIFGFLADRYGRVPVVVSTNVIGGIFGIVSSFSSSFLMFVLTRFVVGLTWDAQYFVMYILVLEYVSSSYRSFVTNVPLITFLSATLALFPWVAYWIHDWKWFGIAIATPQLLCIFLPWIIPESARWLISKGKTEKTLTILKKAAEINGRNLNQEFIDSFENYAKEFKQNQKEKVNWSDLLKTPVLRKRFLLLCAMWVGINLAYDANLRNSENIGANVFITFSIMGAIECPADLITIFLMEKVGRNRTTVWSLISSGLLSLSIFFVEKGSTMTLMIIAICGRFMITVACNVGMQYIVEVLPTAARAQGSGTIHTFGTMAIFFSPALVYLSKFGHWVPYVILGIISLGAGFLTIWLPETKGENLPDSLNDAEISFKDQPLFYNTFTTARNKKKTITSNDGEKNCAFEDTKF